MEVVGSNPTGATNSDGVAARIKVSCHDKGLFGEQGLRVGTCHRFDRKVTVEEDRLTTIAGRERGLHTRKRFNLQIRGVVSGVW